LRQRNQEHEIMTKQIDELMLFVAENFTATERDAVDELRATLEAALKPGEVVGYVASPITWKSDRFHSEQTPKITQHPQPEYGFVHPVYTTPPAQTDALKRIAAACTDPDTTDALDALVAAPPAQTPPRLTDAEVDAIARQPTYLGHPYRAIETAVRRSFGVNDE
jgi:hypothetical protein